MKIVKRLVVLVSMLACIGVMVGCDSSDDVAQDETTFKNESTATITVKPKSNETFATFILEPGQENTVKREGGKMDYSYTSTKKVIDVYVPDSEVLFTDPINL
jgi:hypothetical protein